MLQLQEELLKIDACPSRPMPSLPVVIDLPIGQVQRGKECVCGGGVSDCNWENGALLSSYAK